MLKYFRQKKSFHFALLSALLTCAALGAAMISAVAGQVGQDELASLGSKAALGLALIIVLYVVPKLARSVRLEYLHSDFSIHLPNGGFVFLGLIVAVTVLALSSGNNLLYVVLALLLSTLVTSWAAARLSLGRVGVSARFPDHIFAGESVAFEVTMTNRKRLLPTLSVGAAMKEPRPSEAARAMAGLAYFPIIPAKTEARSRVERSFPKRGVYPVRGFVMSSRFPFGFIEQRRFIDAPCEVVVYPQPRPIDEFSNLSPFTQGQIESHVKGSGSDLYAIRPYLSSDHHHHLDWKATAKTNQLMVREFTRDDDWRVTIAFDVVCADQSQARPEAPEILDQFERAITLAASLIDYFSNAGAEVRLLSRKDDSGFGLGQLHRYKLLRQLAQLTPATNGDEPEPVWLNQFSSPGAAQEQMRILITSTARISMAPPETHVVCFEEL